MLSGHRPCASAHVAEPIGSRRFEQLLKESLVETIDDHARFVTRDEIGGGGPAQRDGWGSAGRGLQQNQPERVAARRQQQEMHRPIFRHEIVAVFVPNELGVHPVEPRPFGSIANDKQATTET